MRQFIDPAEDREETNYWIPVSFLLAAVLLLILVFFAAGMAQTAQAVQATQGGQTQQTEQTEQGEMAAIDLKAREAALAAREKAFAESEAALKELAGIRTGIIDELSDRLSELKLPVEINKVSGNIRFTEAVLFGVNKDTLNADGQQYLKTFVPAYLSILLSSKYEKYLDQVIIEGHADNGGTYQYNLDLSQKRANAVVKFIQAQNLARLPDGVSADRYFSVSARSFNDPVLVNGDPDRNKSRRVEFVFRLKEEEMMKQLQDLYKGER